MSTNELITSHYSRGSLEQNILAALRAAGKDIEHLSPEDLSGLDEFHLGGRESTQELAAFMHLLDVGCGVGGPARYFASSGCRVTGVDLTAEFVRVAERLTRLVKLESRATFAEASAFDLPFASETFDGAYEIHVGMNIADKAGLFREVARVLKPGARFAIFDIVRTGDGPLSFPFPWAQQPEASFVASIDDYRHTLQTAGFRIEHQRERKQFAIDFMAKVRAVPSPPVLSVFLLMGEQAPLMMQNVGAAINTGILEPVEFVGVKQ